MKKWMVYGLIGAFTAGMAVAEDSVPWWKKPFVKTADEATQVIPPAPAAPAPSVSAPAPSPEKPRIQPSEGQQRPQLTPEQKEKMKARAAQVKQRDGAGERLLQPNPQAVEKMKVQHEALMQLGEAARNEADPVKKEALIAELRAKLTEIADKMQIEAKRRLEQAEKELPRLRKRLADAETNKAARIEEQFQRILAGQPLKGPEAPGEGKHKKGPKPAAE